MVGITRKHTHRKENDMNHPQEQEDRDYEDGVAHTQWLIAKSENLDLAPVWGEDGWTEGLEAERQELKERLFGL